MIIIMIIVVVITIMTIIMIIMIVIITITACGSFVPTVPAKAGAGGRQGARCLPLRCITNFTARYCGFYVGVDTNTKYAYYIFIQFYYLFCISLRSVFIISNRKISN